MKTPNSSSAGYSIIAFILFLCLLSLTFLYQPITVNEVLQRSIMNNNFHQTLQNILNQYVGVIQNAQSWEQTKTKNNDSLSCLSTAGVDCQKGDLVIYDAGGVALPYKYNVDGKECGEVNCLIEYTITWEKVSRDNVIPTTVKIKGVLKVAQQIGPAPINQTKFNFEVYREF